MTGVIFQLPHVAAVFGLLAWRDTAFVRAAAWAVSFGSFVFAMDINLLALGLPRWIAAFAPIGGSAMMIGWLGLIVVAMAGDRLEG